MDNTLKARMDTGQMRGRQGPIVGNVCKISITLLMCIASFQSMNEANTDDTF